MFTACVLGTPHDTPLGKPSRATHSVSRAGRAQFAPTGLTLRWKEQLCDSVGVHCRWMDPDEGEEDIEAIAEERLEKGPQPAAV